MGPGMAFLSEPSLRYLCWYRGCANEDPEPVDVRITGFQTWVQSILVIVHELAITFGQYVEDIRALALYCRHRRRLLTDLCMDSRSGLCLLFKYH